MSTVSVVTPMYNAASHIGDAIGSVLRQTHGDWEMLVVDDCSSDDSAEIVSRLARRDKRIKLIRSRENLGPAEARNIGIEASEGRYLAFLDSDDLWHPEKLQRQIEFMRSGARLSYTAYQKISEDGAHLGRPIPVRDEVGYAQMLNTNAIPCLTAMLDVRQVGKRYMPAVGHEDYAYWLNILRDGVVAHGLNQVLAYYRVRSGSVSNDKLKAAGFQWRIYRRVEKLSLPRSLYHFTCYTYHGLKKQRIAKVAET